MSSTPYAAPLRLEVGFSRRLAALLLGVHLGALGLLPLSGLPAGVWLTLAGAALFSLRLSWRRHLAKGVSLVWEADGRWVCREAGRERRLELLPEAYLAPGLVVLRFRETKRGRRRSVVILPDSLDAESFRRLKVRLRRGIDEVQPR